MSKRNLDRNALGRLEDWHGNNAALPCPMCGKVFIVSGFINKGQRQCPKCGMSTAKITNGLVTLEWSDVEDEPKVLSRSELESANRLDEFVSLVGEGGAVSPESVKKKLPKAEMVAFIDRKGKMVAVAAQKRASQIYAAQLRKKSGFELSNGVPELGYVAVHRDWRGLKLSSRVVQAVLLHFGEGVLFATTCDPKMKCTLAKNNFRRVGREWPAERQASEKLGLWIRD